MSTPWTEMYEAAASGVSEIVEEEEGNNSSELFEINHGVSLASVKEEAESSLFSFDVNGAEDEDSVYVAVGKSESSMDALLWTLAHFVNTSTTLYLIHVFPEIRHIPSPLGLLPKSQVSPTQVEKYMAQEREKRIKLLEKFLHICSASKVKVDTVLIESDMVATAILDLIPILNIRKLVVGTTNFNSNPRKLKSRRTKSIGIADQIFRSAPNTCHVKVVCEGKEVITQMIGSPSHSSSPLGIDDQQKADDQHDDSFACMCFKPKF